MKIDNVMSLKTVWVIAKRDFKAYFASPIAYIIIALFCFIAGWFFFNFLDFFYRQNMQFQQFGQDKGLNLIDGVVAPFLGNSNLILLFLVPFVTMRLVAEEKKQNTLELLLTAPVRLSEIVLGKFLSAFMFVGVILSSTFVLISVLYWNGNPDVGVVLSSYLGTFLLVSCYLSFGLFFSAIAENQIVAGALTLVFSLFFWLINWAADAAGPVFGAILEYLSLINHYNNFAKGLVVTSDIVFYVSFIFFGLFLTHRVLDSYRWR